MIASIVISRGRILRIGIAYYNKNNDNVNIITFYDTYDLKNTLKYLEKTTKLYIPENHFIEKLVNCNCINKKIILNGDPRDKYYYAMNAYTLLKTYEKIPPYKIIEPDFLKLPYDLNVGNLINDYFKEIKFYSKLIDSTEILFLQSLNSKEKIKERIEKIECIKNVEIDIFLLKFSNSIFYENNSIRKLKLFYELYNSIKYLNSFEIPFLEKTNLELPIFINENYKIGDNFLTLFKNDGIPLLGKLMEVHKILLENVKKYAEELNVEIQDKKDFIFIRKGDSLNFSEYFNCEILIRKEKNKIFFTTEKLQKFSLNRKMIEAQMDDLINAFLDDNLNLNYKEIRKSIENINEIRQIYLLKEISEFTKIRNPSAVFLEKSPNLIISGPPTYYSCKRLPFHILTGNNMAGKSTYLKNLLIFIILTQSGVLINSSIVKSPIYNRIFYLREPTSNFNKESSFEYELRKIKETIENSCSDSLVLIDEIGKSGTYEEGLSIAILFCRILFKKSVTTFFITHFENLYHKLKNEKDRFYNILNADDFLIRSDKSEYKSITKDILGEAFNYEHKNKLPEINYSTIHLAIEIENNKLNK